MKPHRTKAWTVNLNVYIIIIIKAIRIYELNNAGETLYMEIAISRLQHDFHESDVYEIFKQAGG